MPIAATGAGLLGLFTFAAVTFEWGLATSELGLAAIFLDAFKRQLKRLSRRYPRIRGDLQPVRSGRRRSGLEAVLYEGRPRARNRRSIAPAPHRPILR